MTEHVYAHTDLVVYGGFDGEPQYAAQRIYRCLNTDALRPWGLERVVERSPGSAAIIKKTKS